MLLLLQSVLHLSGMFLNGRRCCCHRLSFLAIQCHQSKLHAAAAAALNAAQVRGVFNGAALVFYSYIGFDSVACSAEEVRRPSRDLPLGILGALGCVTVCYMLMSAVLVS